MPEEIFVRELIELKMQEPPLSVWVYAQWEVERIAAAISPT